MANDSLARGARSAVFPSCSHVSQQKWDSIFNNDEPQEGVALSTLNYTHKGLGRALKQKRQKNAANQKTSN